MELIETILTYPIKAILISVAANSLWLAIINNNLGFLINLILILTIIILYIPGLIAIWFKILNPLLKTIKRIV